MRSSQEIDSEIGELLSEADHIHNKAIFDAINQAMKLHRPYSLKGEPMPWSLLHRKSSFIFLGSQENSLDKIL